MNRYISTLLNVVAICAAWYATTTNNPYATNLTYFMSAVILIIALLLMSALATLRSKLAAENGSSAAAKAAMRSTPGRVIESHIADLLWLSPLVLYGWWWCAACVAFQWGIVTLWFNELASYRAEQSAKLAREKEAAAAFDKASAAAADKFATDA